MPAEIVTTEDLREFKIDLCDELKKILKEYYGQSSRKWLKSDEVRELLGISSGTLRTLRDKGIISYTKVGGVMFYEFENIKKMLEQNEVNNGFRIGRRG